MLVLSVGSIMVARPGNNLVILLVGIVAAGTIFQTFDVIDFWFQSQTTARYTVFARNTAFLLLALVKILLIVFKAPLIAFALAGLCEIAVGAAGLVIVYTRYGLKIRAWSVKFTRCQSLLKDSWSLVLAGAVIAVYMKIDQIMLGNMIGDRSVGIYSAATSISELWYALPGIIVVSVYPHFIKIRQYDEIEYLDKLQSLYNVLVRIAIVISIITTLTSSIVISVLFGSNYHAASNVLAIHVWGSIFVFHGMAKSIFIQCENMQLHNLVCTAIPALLNILLNLFLINRLGAEGAAIATVFSQFMAAAVIPLVNKRDRINVIMLFRAITFKTNKGPTVNA
jgi:PST family polysaccharide transporter